MEEVLSTSFLTFAGYNLQRRAIPDARDGLKWGARQLLHAQMLGGFTYNKPFKKAIKSVSQAMGFSYVHGDASAYGTFIRMGKPFSYRYPLQEVNGNYGTLINPDDHSASRYVEMRGSRLASLLLADLNKDTITEWEETYDLEGKFPRVLPSKGFYGIVNGCISIGSGMSCSIPAFNLKEVNEALIKLINNRDISFDEIVCYPDFPTGGIILNKDEVKESLLNGTGAACKIRAEVEYDSEERCFIVREMPYSTFTNTICKELAILLEDNPNCGIKDFVDYTGIKPDLRIYLVKNANPEKVLKNLYKNTSLQTHYSINMVMLDEGTTPKIFGWREALQSHIDHEKIVYRRSFQYDLEKINHRIHIINGLLICLAKIEEVIQVIKNAPSSSVASQNLQKNFKLDEEQTKAVLDMKLARLARLEVDKLVNEKEELDKEANRINNILNDEGKFNQELIHGWQEVANKFGDTRRTKIMNTVSEKEEDELIENKTLLISLTNQNGLYISAISSLYTQKRAGLGNKIKLSKDEYVISSCKCETIDTVLLFTKKGLFYHYPVASFPLEEKIYLEDIGNDSVCAIAGFNKNTPKHIIFFTKNSIIKKSLLSEYQVKRGNGAKALNLTDGDEIASICFCDDEDVGILTKKGFFIRTSSSDIRAIGRIAAGVKGIKLASGDEVVAGRVIPKDVKSIITVSEDGYVNRTPLNEFSISGRTTKGLCAQKSSTALVDFITINDEKEIIIATNNSCIKFELSSVPATLTRAARGVIGIKIKDNDKVIRILKN